MLNDASPIVPPMKNVVGNTHAETRLEIEARARAEQAAQAAALAEREQKANKKSPVSLVLAIVFGALALGAGGFALYEYTENDKLQNELKTTQSSYSEAKTNIETLEDDNSRLKRLNANLQEELDALKASTTEPETPDENPDGTSETPETPENPESPDSEQTPKES